MADSITHALLGGIAPFQRNAPRRVTVEFEPGQTLVLEDHALAMWWTEYQKLYAFYRAATEEPEVIPPPITADAMRQVIQNIQNNKVPKE